MFVTSTHPAKSKLCCKIKLVEGISQESRKAFASEMYNAGVYELCPEQINPVAAAVNFSPSADAAMLDHHAFGLEAAAQSNPKSVLI